MKTSEFIKRMEDIDLSVVVGVSFIDVYYKTHKIMSVRTNELWAIDTIYCGFLNKTPEKIRKVAITEAIEYINTPIEERKDPQKYYLRLPDEYNLDNKYLNYYEYLDELFFSDNVETDEYQTKFTQEEIDNLPNQNFVKILTKEEVK